MGSCNMSDKRTLWESIENAMDINDSSGKPPLNFQPTGHRRVIYKTSRAPTPLGPYNQAVRVDDTLYISVRLESSLELRTFSTVWRIRQHKSSHTWRRS